MTNESMYYTDVSDYEKWMFILVTYDDVYVVWTNFRVETPLESLLHGLKKAAFSVCVAAENDVLAP